MMSQTGQQIIIIHSRNKDNQAMEFGQLIEYIMRHAFLQKSCRKWS